MTACRMLFEAVSGRVSAKKHENFKMERRLCDALMYNFVPCLKPAILAMCFEHCKVLVNGLKSAPDGRVIIFSDEKTWTFYPVRYRKNDLYLSLREEGESTRTLSKT